VRLYRNYDPDLDQGPVQMVSAFRVLSEMIPVRHGSGLILDWKQSGSGSLLVGGDSRIVRLWDAGTETQVMVSPDRPKYRRIGPDCVIIKDLDTNSDAPVTSLVSDNASGSTFVAGFADGTVKVFDRRLEGEDAVVRSYNAHSSWVQNVRWHPGLGAQILTAR
jgi:regulator-associated protein of mTOR